MRQSICSFSEPLGGGKLLQEEAVSRSSKKKEEARVDGVPPSFKFLLQSHLCQGAFGLSL